MRTVRCLPPDLQKNAMAKRMIDDYDLKVWVVGAGSDGETWVLPGWLLSVPRFADFATFAVVKWSFMPDWKVTNVETGHTVGRWCATREIAERHAKRILGRKTRRQVLFAMKKCERGNIRRAASLPSGQDAK